MQPATTKTTDISQTLPQPTKRRVLIVALLGGTIATGCIVYSVSRFAIAPQTAVSTVAVNAMATSFESIYFDSI